MLTVLTVILVVSLPMTVVAALLLVAGRVQRARERWVIRQIAVTDAIHRELGAVVAPVVRRRPGRRWHVEMSVPFDRPALVGRVASVAHAALARAGARPGAEIAIVLRPRGEGAARRVRRLDPVSVEREPISWTGTSTSRAS